MGTSSMIANRTIAAAPSVAVKNPGTYLIRTVAYEQNLRRGLKISRADVAHYMLRCLGDDTTISHCIGIAN